MFLKIISKPVISSLCMYIYMIEFCHSKYTLVYSEEYGVEKNAESDKHGIFVESGSDICAGEVYMIWGWKIANRRVWFITKI